MKRLFTAAVLFVFALSMCLTSTLMTKRVEKKVGKPLEKCVENYTKGQKDLAKANMEEARKNWKDIKETTAVFVSHFSVDDLDEQISKASDLMKNENGDFVPEINLCLIKIQNLCDDEKLTFNNVF